MKIHNEVTIGHVHLKVANIERALEFYRDIYGVSEAIYLDDPDGNGVELYVDRPRNTWKVKNDGEVEMVSERLDVEGLLGELGSEMVII